MKKFQEKTLKIFKALLFDPFQCRNFNNRPHLKICLFMDAIAGFKHQSLKESCFQVNFWAQ